MGYPTHGRLEDFKFILYPEFLTLYEFDKEVDVEIKEFLFIFGLAEVCVGIGPTGNGKVMAGEI